MYRQLSASTSRPARPTGGQRRGFTLVELLVVITIIAMLVGLLIPAIQAAKSTARKTQCMNNQRNLGTAVISYATTKEKFPPAFSLQPDPLGVFATPQAVGWVPNILPQIEQNELYRAFQNNTWSNIPTAQIDVLMCPVGNQSSSPAPLSYVVNGGAWDFPQSAMYPMDFQENGVFFDEFTPKYSATIKPKPTPPIDLAYLSNHDGNKNTIMLSENLDASDWIAVATPSSVAPQQPGTGVQGNSYWNTITWQQPPMGAPAGWGTVTPPPGAPLNKQLPSPANTDADRGRPSSNHSGGFMVTFCDGHTQFVSEDIQYRVYCLLMSPDSNNSKWTRPQSLNGTRLAFPSLWWQGGIVNGTLTPLSESDIP